MAIATASTPATLSAGTPMSAGTSTFPVVKFLTVAGVFALLAYIIGRSGSSRDEYDDEFEDEGYDDDEGDEPEYGPHRHEAEGDEY